MINSTDTEAARLVVVEHNVTAISSRAEIIAIEDRPLRRRCAASSSVALADWWRAQGLSPVVAMFLSSRNIDARDLVTPALLAIARREPNIGRKKFEEACLFFGLDKQADRRVSVRRALRTTTSDSVVSALTA